MKSFYRFCLIICMILIVSFVNNVNSQGTLTSYVTFNVNGCQTLPYKVDVKLELLDIITKNVSAAGYNYDVRFGYEIKLTALNTAQKVPKNWCGNSSSSLDFWDLRVSFHSNNQTSGANNFLTSINVGQTISGVSQTTTNQWIGSAAIANNPGLKPGVVTPSSMGFNSSTIFINAVGMTSGSVEWLKANSSNTGVETEGTSLPLSGDKITVPIFNGGVVLPISLVSFEAESTRNSIELNWETASERNNDYFIIEKSTDMSNWETVERVQGAGNATTTNTYNVSDKNINQGINYYRLTQVDFNGNSETFNVISENFIPVSIIAVYDASGKSVDINQKGLVIIHYSDNSIEKIFNN